MSARAELRLMVWVAAFAGPSGATVATPLNDMQMRLIHANIAVQQFDALTEHQLPQEKATAP